MNEEFGEKVRARLFVGCQLSKELKLQLDQSALWREEKIAHSISLYKIVEIHHQHKDYLGIYIEKDQLTLNEFRALENHLREVFKVYCPQQAGKPLKICLLSQTFIS